MNDVKVIKLIVSSNAASGLRATFNVVVGGVILWGSVCSSGHLMICTYRPAATHVHPQLKNPAKIGDGGSGNLTHLVKNNECQRYPMIILTYSFCSTCVYVGYRNIGISMP